MKPLSVYLTITVCLLLSAASYAQPLYRYQDDKGRWHFTDKKPLVQNGSKAAEKFQLQQANRIDLSSRYQDVILDDNLCLPDLQRKSLYYQNLGGHLGKKGQFNVTHKPVNDHLTTINASNDFFAPVEVEIVLTKQSNITAKPTLPLRKLIAPQSTQTLSDISPLTSAPWSFTYSFRHQLGDSKAVHDSDCYYLPPVPAGQQFLISQAFNGEFSHNSLYSRYAVDIAMDVGTPIYAARAGIVIRRKTEYLFAGLNKSYLSRANSVSILHSDGTISIYAHLKFRSILVKEGMRVKTGQVIAQSGNTGYSSGPHLHFEIVKNDNMQWLSQPFKFMLNGSVVTPIRGMLLSNDADNEKIISDIVKQTSGSIASEKNQ